VSQPLDPLESAADDTIKSWPDVRPKQAFGHRGYVHGGKMFAFIAEKGLSIKAANAAHAEALYAAGAAVPFEYGEGMEMRGWPVLALGSDAELSAALEAAWEAYERFS
jgi:hypothetical protein